MSDTTSTNGWIYKRLEECTSDGVISYGIVQPGSHCDEGVPVIRVNNITNGSLTLDDVLKVAPEIEVKYKRTRLKGGEVLLTLVGSTGQSLVVPNEMKGWNVPRAIAVIRVDENIGANWVNICLQSSHTKHFLDVRANTTVQKTLNLKDVKDIPILLPPKPVRDFIENTEQGFSKKIALNENINKGLEQIAQAIFKSWFVDFEPTKAKIAAREALIVEKPDATPDQIATAEQQAAIQAIAGAGDVIPTEQLQIIADLFPNQLVESELGEIPEGWKLGVLSDLFEFNPKRTLKKGTKAPYLDMKNVPVSGHLAEDVVLKEMKSGTKFINGDTLLARITPCLENGKTAYVDFLDDGQVGWGSTEFIVMRPKGNIHTSIAYLIARQETFRAIAIQTMTGTSGRQRADAKALATKKWVIYPETLLAKFSQISSSFMALGKVNGDQNKSLSLMRDTLLPKLLAGEIAYAKNGGGYE